MTTKMYKAFVKSKETGELTIIESEYTSKKDFARDLRANGYAVKFISTPEKFDEDCENYHWELKRRKNIREAMKQHKASKEQDEQEAQEKAEENKDTFEYRNYIISGNERTGIIAIDNHGNFSPKVYKTVEEAKKAVDEDIEYAEKKYAEMEAEQTEVEETSELETETNEITVETVEKAERKINMKKSYNEMTIEELNKEHIRLINWADEAETDRQAKSRLKKVSEFETYYKSRVEELRATQATNETTVQETVEQAAEQETTTETGNSGFEYTRSQAQEIIMAGTSIAREKYREKHGIHSPMDLKKFSRKQLDDYLSKELDYINKFLNDTLPKEVFNAMKGETMCA